MNITEIIKFKKSDVALESIIDKALTEEQKEEITTLMCRTAALLEMGTLLSNQRKVGYDLAENYAFYYDSKDDKTDGADLERLSPSVCNLGHGFKTDKGFYSMNDINNYMGRINQLLSRKTIATRGLIEELSNGSVEIIDNKIYTKNRYFYVMLFFFTSQAKRFTIPVKTKGINKDTLCVLVNLLNNTKTTSVSDAYVTFNQNKIVVTKKKFDKDFKERFIGFEKMPKIIHLEE